MNKDRFLSLDVFRGLTLFLMIIVNTPGASSFPTLIHADWNGFTLADWIFPSFLFAVGNSLSFVKSKWEQKTNTEVLTKIFKRTFLLFLFGFLLSWFPFFHTNAENNISSFPISDVRILGVLQRIAITYCIAALMVRFMSTRSIIISAVVFLLLYWLIIVVFGDQGHIYDYVGNAGTKLDIAIIPPQHLYIGGSEPFEPEGLLGTLTAVVNVIAGYLAGAYIKTNKKSYEMLAKLAMTGFALLLIAFFWDMVMPINKKLWTSSFVLHTVGLDCLIMTCIIYLVDFLDNGRYTYFFQVFGKNTMFIYLISEMIPILLNVFHINGQGLYRWLYDHSWGCLGEGHIPSLLFSVSFAFLCWLVGYWMDKKRIYINV